MLINALNKILGTIGYSIEKKIKKIPIDITTDKEFLEFYEKCMPFTQTSIERMYSLFNACLYVVSNKIEGDLVECGVWKGGSAMMMAFVLKSRGITNKKIYLYDTYEGMSEPTEKDVSIHGKPASEQLKEEDKLHNDSIWCYASYEEVIANLKLTGYPRENLVFIKGKVEDTLQNNLPENLALLRLDTDWYESTKVELEKLYPLLRQGAPLIIDDFGHWEGAKRAVQEYFLERGLSPLIQRIDITGRLIIKC